METKGEMIKQKEWQLISEVIVMDGRGEGGEKMRYGVLKSEETEGECVVKGQ